MREITNECVDCGLPCIGKACPYVDVKRFYCDECGSEEQLYYFDSEELCLDCIALRLEPVDE